MKRWSSLEIIRTLQQDGWQLVGVRGSHQFEHPAKPGKVTVPHPRKDLDPKLARAILRQAGLA